VGGSIAIADPNNVGAMILAPTASAKVYNVKQESAQAMPDLPSALTDAQAALLNGYLYVYGGSTDGTAAGTSSQLYRLKLDDAGNVDATAWETLTSPGGENARRGGALVATGGKLYVVGGKNGNDVLGRVVYAYTPPTDTVADSWTDLVTLNYGVYHAAIAGLGGKIYVAGGVIDTLGKRTNTVVEIDPSLRTFQTLSTNARLPSARSGMGAAVVNGQLFVVGGSESGQDNSGNATDTPLDAVLRSVAY
jgi:N-acetylneuraminic acid mutarotase